MSRPNSSLSAELAPSSAALWRTLAAYIHQACAAFGLPSAVAGMVWLTRVQHKHICAWLRPLEALLRRLIFIDAYALALAEAELAAPEAKARARRAMGAAVGACFNPEDSESWSARFDPRLGGGPRPRLAHRLPGKPSAANPRATSSAPCALRLESLIRAFNLREALARRLARRLREEVALARLYITALNARTVALLLWRPVADAIAVCGRALTQPARAVDSS